MRCRRLSSLRACFSTSSGMPGLGDGLLELEASAPPSSPSPSSFWMVFICSRRMNSRWRLSIVSLVRSSISRESLSTSIRCASSSSTLSSRACTLNVSSSACFSAALMSMKPATMSASAAGRGEVLHGGHQLLRRLRQQVEHFGSPLLELQEARLHVLACRGAVGETLHARDQERVARQELLHAEAFLPLRDQMVAAVLGGDVAQHLRNGPDLVEIVGTGVLAWPDPSAGAGRPAARS